MRRLLDQTITVLKPQTGKDAFGDSVDAYDEGRSVRASHSPVSDAEKQGNGQLGRMSVSRFVVSHTSYTAKISGKDRIAFEGAEWMISGLKTVGRKRFIEITAWKVSNEVGL
ncbi:MAG: head-tail adaptor protein [Rhodobacteraceae bacterium]|nr:head-tail adaptor protein [Paracoccaceae bacterium]